MYGQRLSQATTQTYIFYVLEVAVSIFAEESW